MRDVLIVVLVCFTSGCGLVFQGTTQTVRLSTMPEGAAIEFSDHHATSPATVTLSRRVNGRAIYRASKEGYQPACRIIDCRPRIKFMVLDGLPMALPLLVDGLAGTLGNCDDATLTLEPVQAGEFTYALPSDADILVNPDTCIFPYLYDQRFAAQAERIIVSSGGLQQHYDIVGNVDFGRLGFDRTDAGAVALRGFILAWAHRTFSKATPAEINALLRTQALHQYGKRVDALINVSYQSDPANNVFATAVAVHFTDGSPQAGAGTTSTRLGELEGLRKNGLIDQREYEQKRVEILRGL
jgi:hypothetical protein